MSEVLYDIGISAVEYTLGSDTVFIDELDQQGLLESPRKTLQDFGFVCARLSRETPHALAFAAARKLLETNQVDPLSVDAIFYAGATCAGHAITTSDPMSSFNYPVAWLQYELGLTRAVAFGLSQVGCLGMVSSVALASDFLRANDRFTRALCVTADVLPAGSKREMIYNVISDGACAAVVEKDSKCNRILAYRQITKGYYWDSITQKNQIVAAYFPTARHIILDTLISARIDPSELAWVIPHNVSLRSWEILLKLVGIGPEKLFAENIARIAHVIAADNCINLKDAAEAGKLLSGDKLLLFTFGFGANWACMVLQH